MMIAHAHPRLALRPFLPADLPLLAEIFRARRRRNSLPAGGERAADPTMEKRPAAGMRAA